MQRGWCDRSGALVGVGLRVVIVMLCGVLGVMCMLQ